MVMSSVLFVYSIQVSHGVGTHRIGFQRIIKIVIVHFYFWFITIYSVYASKYSKIIANLYKQLL